MLVVLLLLLLELLELALVIGGHCHGGVLALKQLAVRRRRRRSR